MGLSKLGDVVQRTEDFGELVRRGVEKHDGSVTEAEKMVVGSKPVFIGKGGKPRQFAAVTFAQPDLPPPHLRGISRVITIRIRPKFADRRPPNCLNALHKWGVARLVFPYGFHVVGEALKKILLLPVRHIDGRDLDRASNGLLLSHCD